MSNIERSRWARGKREIRKRLDQPVDGANPVFKASNIHYEFAGRTRGVACGGIGAVQLLARKVGLVDAIDRRLHVLKLHLPYHESDHVLNIAYNVLCGGTCLEDIERRRNDAVFLDALDAERIPDPTTAGDFCRRFAATDVLELQEAIDEARLKVWAKQPAMFFREAVIDMDGSLVETSGECKAGMDIAYDGTWGYHPLLVPKQANALRFEGCLGGVGIGAELPPAVPRGKAMHFGFGFRHVCLGFLRLCSRGSTGPEHPNSGFTHARRVSNAARQAIGGIPLATGSKTTAGTPAGGPCARSGTASG